MTSQDRNTLWKRISGATIRQAAPYYRSSDMMAQMPRAGDIFVQRYALIEACIVLEDTGTWPGLQNVFGDCEVFAKKYGAYRRRFRPHDLDLGSPRNHLAMGRLTWMDGNLKLDGKAIMPDIRPSQATELH